VEAELRRQIWTRARDRCEYCHFSATLAELPFEIDHVIAKTHDGETQESNLALSCFYCNSYKGPNIAGLDPQTSTVVRLFHPRRDVWDDHFRWVGPVLEGVTDVARATILVLRINHPDALAVGQALIEEDEFPPGSREDNSGGTSAGPRRRHLVRRGRTAPDSRP